MKKLFLVFALLFGGFRFAVAQETAVKAPAVSWQSLNDIKEKIARGRMLLDAGDASSRPLLRAASQDALKLVSENIAPDVLTGNPTLPQTGAPADALRQAAQAHLLWGAAANNFGGDVGRDEAITAWARALKLAGDDEEKFNPAAEEARFRLIAALRQGLPLVATDDALQIIADKAQGDLWRPQRFSFDLSTLHLSSQKTDVRELLVTSGKLFPPVMNNSGGAAELTLVPPYYRVVAPEALPPSLKLDRMSVGYERETSGPNRGLWRQAVRVYYASPYLTKDNRDDAPRAEALCGQFLKIHTLMETALGLKNAQADDRVTTLWLLEISALWPSDDPEVQGELGNYTPDVNTPNVPGAKIERPIERTPYEIPWRAAGQSAIAPGEVMFYRSGEARSEGEWLRQISHEYGHVVLPPFDGFAPPLEPFANGALGENLALLWAAQLPTAQMLPPNLENGDAEKLAAQLNGYVELEVLPALKVWNTNGPASALRKSGTKEAQQYLRGLTTYIERVYGADVLNAALQKVAARPDGSTLSAQSLLDALAEVLRANKETSVSLWLPGAFETSDVAALISRAPATLAANTKRAIWLYIPAGSSTLRVEWRGEKPLKVEGAWKQISGEAVLSIALSGKSGWQKFVFSAPADVQIMGAEFRRAM